MATTEISNQSVLKRARACLEDGRFNEGLAMLDGEEETDQVLDLLYRLRAARSRRIKELLEEASKAAKSNQWDHADELVRRAQQLDKDSEDERIRYAATDLARQKKEVEQAQVIAEGKRRAKSLIKSKSGVTVENLDNAIQVLERTISMSQDNIELEALLDEARQRRSDLLRSQGLVETLEQSEQFQQALEEINDMIARGIAKIEIQGKARNTDEYRGALESKARQFAEKKADKYMNLAKETLQRDPALALNYVETGLQLKAIPAGKNEDLKNLRLQAEKGKQQREEATKRIEEALQATYRKEFEFAIGILRGVRAAIPSLEEAKAALRSAEQGLRGEILQQSSLALVRARSQLRRGALTEAKEELIAPMSRLHELEETSQVRKVIEECRKTLEEIDRQEELEEQIQAVVAQAQNDFAAETLEALEDRLDSLKEEVHEDPRIRKIRIELTQRQDILKASEKIRTEFEQGHLQTALEAVRTLKRRAANRQDVTLLASEIEATASYRKALSAYEDGNIREAQSAFRKVVSLGGLYLVEAEQRLEEIKQRSKLDRKARRLYNAALRHQKAHRYGQGYQILNDIVDETTVLGDEIIALRLQLREQWRDNLVQNLQQSLRSRSYEKILQMAEELEILQEPRDFKLIARAKRWFHVSRAQSAAADSDWAEALEHWKKAQKHDPTSKQISKGVERACRKRAVQDADISEEPHERIEILEEVLDLRHEDAEVDERLIEVYLETGEYTKASRLANARVRSPTKLGRKFKLLGKLCRELKTSQKRFDNGAYQESLQILKSCLSQYPACRDLLEKLAQSREEEALKALLAEANNLENQGESPVRILLKYKEMLELDPLHKEARLRNQQLLEELEQRIEDLIGVSIYLDEDENASLEEVTEHLSEIRDIMKVATKTQHQKLKPHKDMLTQKRRALEAFKRKLRQIDAFLSEGKHTHDFVTVDRIVGEAGKSISIHNHQFSKIRKKVQDAKERCEQAQTLAEKIGSAFREEEFDTLERLAKSLARVDPEDEFNCQKALGLTDPMTDENIPFSQLSDWAKQRRNNLKVLEAWYEVAKGDKDGLEKAEASIRSLDHLKDSRDAVATKMERLSGDFERAAERLVGAPEVALSISAQGILKEAETRRVQLLGRSRDLTKEAGQLREDDSRIVEIVEEVARRIEKRQFQVAEPLVVEGLQLAPDHRVLLHFLELIRNERK